MEGREERVEVWRMGKIGLGLTWDIEDDMVAEVKTDVKVWRGNSLGKILKGGVKRVDRERPNSWGEFLLPKTLPGRGEEDWKRTDQGCGVAVAAKVLRHVSI